MKFPALFITMLCVSVATMAQQRADTLFFDDFKAQSLDRSKWNVELVNHPANNEQQGYVDSIDITSLTDGNLSIKPIYHPGYMLNGQKRDFLSGRINTEKKFEFIYGTATARIKMSAGAGLWPAFWALGEGKWPDCGEIDIMETVGDSSWVSHALHGPGYFGNTPIAYRAFFPKDMDVTQWHTYSVKWSANSIVFSVDNVVTYTVTRAIVEKYGRWAFDGPKFIIVNFAVGGGYPNGVNKITTPYYGLSQSSVDKIKAGKAEMLVDWVLVTR